MYQQICSPIPWVFSLFCWCFSLLCNKFLVSCSPICELFSLVSLVWGDTSNKILLQAMPKILLPMFFPKVFMVVSLTLKFLIHFKLIILYGVSRWSSFIFLLVSVQFSQHHSLNKLSLAYCMCLLPLSSINKCVILFLGSLFCFTDLCICFYTEYHAVLITMALQYSLILGSMILPILFFFLRIAASMWGLLWFHIHFWNIFSSCVKYIIGILIGIMSNL